VSKPIYLLTKSKGFTEAWHQLADEDKSRIWSQVEEADKRAGAKWVILCDSRWADEGTPAWGVLEYPDIDAYHRKVQELEKLQWWRYFTAESILGTKHED
jgi:hypothetical protein